MEIKPCPECGATNNYIELDEDGYSDSARWIVCAGDCSLVGPTCFSDADAVAAWNRLSDAAALLRAVETLHAAVSKCMCSIEANEEYAAMLDCTASMDETDYEITHEVEATSMMAALIALAAAVKGEQG